MKKITPLLLMVVFQSSLFAQQISSNEKTEILNEVYKLIENKYVNESVARKTIDSLTLQKYDENTIEDFRRRLSRDLRKYSNDKHFDIIYNANNDFSQAISSNNEKNNFGFTKVEILSGNIGYLKISSFENPSVAGKAARASLSFLSNADGIIIDLRNNNGGRKAMVQFLLSYFFEENSKHLFSIYGRNEEFHGYTEAGLQEGKLAEVPLYILINKESFSAAEMFAFILQNQKRATLIGEKTAGGGHTIGNLSLGNGFSMNLPVGEIVDPISKKGWEKVGVTPDIEIESDLCFEKAHLIALKNQKLNLEDTTSSDYFNIQWQIDILNSKLEPITLSQDILKSYAGTYGKRILSYDNGKLYYQGRAGIDKAELIPINKIIFRFNEVDFFRINITTDEKGKIVGLKGLYNDGYEDFSKRN